MKLRTTKEKEEWWKVKKAEKAARDDVSITGLEAVRVMLTISSIQRPLRHSLRFT